MSWLFALSMRNLTHHFSEAERHVCWGIWISYPEVLTGAQSWSSYRAIFIWETSAVIFKFADLFISPLTFSPSLQWLAASARSNHSEEVRVIMQIIHVSETTWVGLKRTWSLAYLFFEKRSYENRFDILVYFLCRIYVMFRASILVFSQRTINNFFKGCSQFCFGLPQISIVRGNVQVRLVRRNNSKRSANYAIESIVRHSSIGDLLEPT